MSSLFEIDIDEALAIAGGDSDNQEQLFTKSEAEPSVIGDLQQIQGEFNQYDKVRNNPEVISTPVYNEPSNYVGRNLHRITFNNSENNNDNELLLCHVPTFLRYSTDKGPSCQIAYSASAAAILAMHHFNNGDGSVVQELDGINERCNIRLTTEIINTKSSPINAVRELTRMLTRNSNSISEPQPCAVLGSQISSVTSKMASVSGVFDLFQVSSSAMSTELEDTVQYPMLARSHTDVAGFGEMSISYLKDNMGISNFGILSPNDAYGQGFQKSVLEAAAGRDMNVIAATYLPTLTSEDEIDANIRSALGILKESGCNYIIAAFYPELFSRIMGLAYEMELAGENKLWLISGTADLAPFLLSGKFIIPKDSSAAKAIAGNGIIFCKGGLPGVGGSYDRFTKEWKKLGESENALDYINEKVQSAAACSYDGNFFQSLPHHIVTFTYDAIVGLGLSACGAQESMKSSNSRSTSNSEVFTGKLQRDIFANNTFRGASGDFLLRDEFPTRTADSSYFVMVNTAENELNDTHISYKGSPLSFFWETQNRTWKGKGNFVYAAGLLTAPAEFEARQEESTESTVVWAPILVLALLLVFGLIGWFVYMKKKKKQVDSIWNVDMKELKFDEPPEIIGRGTFGLVLKAEYRGTEVAVKRVMPAKEAKRISGVESREAFSSRSSSNVVDDVNAKLDASFVGTEAQRRVSFAAKLLDEMSTHSGESSNDVETGNAKIEEEKKIEEAKMNSGSHSLNSGTNSGSRSRWRVSRVLQSTLTDEHTNMKNEFVKEMRLLSKLRHPNIVTVMGAVIDNVHEPMLVMEYMQNGSLYDLLHNKTVEFGGEVILPILRDIASGMRFLHSANPPVIHCDLKAANVLVDSRFHAKVADFGLSQKKKVGGGGGTPYWMSPELLLGETGNTCSSDVYSFGIILYEVYSREDPYDGELMWSVLEGIKDPLINKRPPVPSDCPPQIKPIMLDCLLRDPNERPSFAHIDQLLKKLDAESVQPTDLIHTLQKKKELRDTTSVLFDVFPKHIAECLRSGQKVEPTVKDIVTIFFSDVVGFTEIASSLSPLKVSDMLDRLYSTFDNLSKQHDIFKVETIGDAYMAVTNLVKDQESDHAKRIAKFAFDAIKAANSTLIDIEDPTQGYVNIRVGFHSGPVVANVVGSRSPRYCLFGDSVNTASRMESNSKENSIHCSERSAMLLKEQAPEISLVCRGWISVKGKGDMKTYWVEEGVEDNAVMNYGDI